MTMVHRSIKQSELRGRAMTAFGFLLLPVGGALILFGVAAPWVDGRLTLALLLFPWVGSGALRRVRGRSSQVKGACGVAAARALRAPLDLRASATPRAGTCGQAGGLPG